MAAIELWGIHVMPCDRPGVRLINMLGIHTGITEEWIMPFHTWALGFNICRPLRNLAEMHGDHAATLIVLPMRNATGTASDDGE